MEHEIPPGYKPWGEQGVVLIDPTDCPAGHPFTFGQRTTYAVCAAHGHHPGWRCACGREQFLDKISGEIVEQLECISGR